MTLNIHDIARQEMPETIYLPTAINVPVNSHRLSEIVRVSEEGVLCFIFEALSKISCDESMSFEEKVEMIRESELYKSLGPEEWTNLWFMAAHPSSEEDCALEELMCAVGLKVSEPGAVSALDAFDDVIDASPGLKPDVLGWRLFPTHAIDYLAKLYLEIVDVYGTESEVDPDNMIALRVMSDWGE